jgi:hypothetical protein
MKMGPPQKGEIFFAEFYMLLDTQKGAGLGILEHKKLYKLYSSL